MKTQSLKIECPECGFKKIHHEYEKNSSHDLKFWVWYNDQLNDFFSNEPEWCYCQRCGLMFDPLQEAVAV